MAQGGLHEPGAADAEGRARTCALQEADQEQQRLARGRRDVEQRGRRPTAPRRAAPPGGGPSGRRPGPRRAARAPAPARRPRTGRSPTCPTCPARRGRRAAAPSGRWCRPRPRGAARRPAAPGSSSPRPHFGSVGEPVPRPGCSWMASMSDHGELATRLTADLDTRLADADAALAAGYPGERPGRQPVHTVYVPADRYDAGLVPAYGAAALAAVDEHEAAFAELVGDDDIVARVRAKLEAEPVEDLRVDFEDGYVGRSDDEETADVERSAAGAGAEPAGGRCRPVQRDPGQVLRAPPAQPQHQDADGVRLDPPGQRREPRRLGRHAAQGDQRRPGRGHGPRRRDAGPPVRGPGRDAAVDPRPGRDGARRPDGARGRRAADRPALRHLRLLGVHRHRGGVPVARAPGRRPRQADHAGGRRRHRRAALRRLHQHPPRRGRRTPWWARGATTTGWSAARSSTASTRAGTCTRPSCRPGTPRRTRSTARDWPPRSTGSRPTSGARRPAPGAISDEPATARALARYVLRGLDCGAVDAAEVRGLDLPVRRFL